MTVGTGASTDLRELALADPLRPGYHFAAPAGWLNDPNGVTQRDGRYHLFYQYNPAGALHDRIHWGHAVSDDLVHWRDRPIALRPDAEGPDAEGCWSGVLVDDDGRPVIVYSAHRNGRQTACIAYGDATLDTWRKDPRNPVIAGPPPGADVTAFRDHCVWRENGAWRQLIGSGIRGEGGCAFLYESDDLVSWRSLGPLVVGEAGDVRLDDADWTGTMWECADFFRFRPDGTTAAPDATSGDPHLLVFSAWHEGITLHPLVAIGRYRGDRFEIQAYQRLDLGGRHAYAPQTFADENGRRVLWAWMQEGRDEAGQYLSGWSGAMAVPRRLRFDGAVVRQEPVAELGQLRGEELAWRIAGESSRSEGTQAEVVFDAELPASSSVRMQVFETEDAEETTGIVLRRSAQGEVSLHLDRTRSSLDAACDASSRGGSIPSGERTLAVRVYLDRSSIEVFIDGIALTARVYPVRPDATGMRIEPQGGASVRGLAGWRLADAEEPDRVLDPACETRGER